MKYHLSCLTVLRNRHRSFLRQSETSSIDRKEGKIEARAFVELITHVENSIENGIFLNYFPNAQEQNDGKNIIIVFEQGMQQMLKTSVECSSHQQDTLILMKATKIVCNEIFHHMDLNLMALFLMIVNKSLYLPILRCW